MIKKFNDSDIQEIKDILGYGVVSSVNKDKMTAKVKIESRGIVSAELHVLQNTPLLVVVNKNDDVKWKYEAQYVTHDRELGLGEKYKKEYPDIIKTKISGCPTAPTHSQCTQEQEIKIYPWLPYVGQKVLCLFIVGGDGDGFVLGGI